MTSNFFSIPPELQVHILCNLDAVSLVRCAMTCRSLYDILNNSSPLMYIIQLYRYGLEDAGTHIPAVDAVELLLRRGHAWSSLEWTEHIAFEIQHNGSVLDLVGGALAYMDKGNLEIVWVHTSGTDERRLVQRTLNRTMACLAMDPTQDLMVILDDARNSLSTADTVVALVHVSTISGDVPHPLALKDSLEFDFSVSQGYTISSTSPVLQIAHNILALCIKKRGRVLIWDWTTSELLLDTAVKSFHPPPDHFGGCSISLLNSTHFLFACSADSGSIRLYKLDRSTSVDKATAGHLATFHLPPLAEDGEITTISIETEPILAHPLPHTPCLTNNEDRVHVFEITYEQVDWEFHFNPIDNACMVVHQRVFTNYISQKSYRGGPPVDIPWAKWGPSNTLFTIPEHVHGQRVVFISNDRSSPKSIEIFDFSRAGILLANGGDDDDDDDDDDHPTSPALFDATDHWKLSSSSLIESAEWYPYFKSDFETDLPYAYINLDLKEEYPALMIHADGLVGVKVHPDRTVSSHIYTF